VCLAAAAAIHFFAAPLDGTPVNGHFWLFHAGMTDLETTLTVTDTLTGAIRTLHKPPFTLAAGTDVELVPSP
jgi:hypothetical protein